MRGLGWCKANDVNCVKVIMSTLCDSVPGSDRLNSTITSINQGDCTQKPAFEIVTDRPKEVQCEA
jgi:hypothetical protein